MQFFMVSIIIESVMTEQQSWMVTHTGLSVHLLMLAAALNTKLEALFPASLEIGFALCKNRLVGYCHVHCFSQHSPNNKGKVRMVALFPPSPRRSCLKLLSDAHGKIQL